MNLLECISKKGLQIEVDSLKRCQSIDISFINSDGKEDETQFDVSQLPLWGRLQQSPSKMALSHIGTVAGNKELEALFADFCKENGFKTNTVESITVVASADSFEELEEMER